MSEKGLLSSIFGLFKGIFSSNSQPQASAPKSHTAQTTTAAVKEEIADALQEVQDGVKSVTTPSGMTGVAQYIANLSDPINYVTSVEQYIQNKFASSTTMTGVERYIQNQAKG